MKEKDEFLSELGIRLKKARENQRMTQRELTELAGTAKGSVSAYEQGVTEPGVKSLKRIADVLGVSVAWLISGAESVDLGTDPARVSKIKEYIRFLDMQK